MLTINLGVLNSVILFLDSHWFLSDKEVERAKEYLFAKYGKQDFNFKIPFGGCYPKTLITADELIKFISDKEKGL
jgi:hypothetical protein